MSINKWRDAKPGSVIFMTEEEMYEWERLQFIKLGMEKENKMELKLEHEIKDTVAVLRLERLYGHIWLVAKKDGYDHYLCTISNYGIERTQIMTSSGFQVDSDYRIKLVGE